MVFWEGRDRHSSNSGQRAAILGNERRREERASPFPQWDPLGDKLEPDPNKVWGGGASASWAGARAGGSVHQWQAGGGRGWPRGPPCRETSAQGWGDQTLPCPYSPGPLAIFCLPLLALAACLVTRPAAYSCPSLWGLKLKAPWKEGCGGPEGAEERGRG